MSGEGERERDLDGTGGFQRRRWDDLPAPAAPRVQVPLGVVVTLVIYLIGQLAGGIWWAATLQSDVRYLQGENMKLWQQNEVLKLKNEKIETGFDEKVRAKVREILDDWGYLRVRSRKEE
jgi:hypothetical protein